MAESTTGWSRAKTALVGVLSMLLPLVTSYAAHVYAVQQETIKAERQAELKRQEFDNARMADRNADFKAYIPPLLDEDPARVTYAVTMLTVLYPDEAAWVIERAKSAKQSEVAALEADSYGDVLDHEIFEYAPMMSAPPLPSGDRAEDPGADRGEEAPEYSARAVQVARAATAPSGKPKTLAAQSRAVDDYATAWWILILMRAPTREGLTMLSGARVFKRGEIFHLAFGEYGSRSAAERAMLHVRFDSYSPEPVLAQTFCPNPKGSDPVVCH